MFAQGAVGALFAALVIAAPLNVAQAQVAPTLSTAEQEFAVLAGSTVTNTGATVLHGDLGVSPGTAITGFPSGRIKRGTVHDADATAAAAQSEAATEYSSLSSEACTTTYGVPTDIGGLTLSPGVYCFSSSAALTGTLVLDGGGDPNAVWVFEIGSTLTTASNSVVTMANSGQAHNIFWQVGSSATLGTGSTFQGNILAETSITLSTNVTLAGRAIALNGAVTMDSDNVSYCVCVLPYTAVIPKVANTISVAPEVGDVPGTVFGATLSPDGKTVWVAGSNGNSSPGFVSLVDVATQAIDSTFAVGAGPSDIAFSSGGGRAFVTNSSDASLSVVTVPTLDVTQTISLSGVPMTQPVGVTYDGASGHVIVATQGSGNFLADLDATTPVAVGSGISLPGQSGQPAMIPSSAAYYPNKVAVPVFVTGAAYDAGHPVLAIVSAVHGTEVKRVTLWSSGSTPEAVVVSPDGKYAYVSLFDPTGGVKAGGVWVVSLETMTTKTVISTCDPANFGEALSADGQYLLVAGFRENQVALIDTATDTLDVIIPGGNQPNSIALSADNSEAFFTNQSDGTVTVVSFAPSL